MVTHSLLVWKVSVFDSVSHLIIRGRRKWYPLLLYQAHDTNKKGRVNSLLQLEHPNNFLPRYGYLSYDT